MAACTNTRKAVYFNTLQDTTIQKLNVNLEPVIQPNDILSITVSSPNPEATLVFNTPNLPTVSVATSNSSATQTVGYLVNPDGTFQFPVLGAIVAAGKTKKQLSEELVKKLVEGKQLVDPIVHIRFLNFKVTVLGEVARPNVITVANEKITILEALGLAGDLTIYGRRDNLLLIREEAGVKTTHRVNLNSSDILSSPYYYLKTNDIIYAEPTPARISSASSTRQLLPIVLSGLSFFAIVVDRVLR